MLFDALPEPVRDAVYTAIGFPTVAFQELQARQRSLATELEHRLAPVRERAEAAGRRLADLLPSVEVPAPVSDVTSRLDEQVKTIEARVTDLENRIDEVLDKVEGQLPEAAREVVSQARGAAKEARTQLRSFVGRAA